MKVAVVFSAKGSLDFLEVRTSVLRIPQVIQKLRQAQEIVDTSIATSIDLMSFMVADDVEFWRNERFRKLCNGVVQIALYERFLSKNKGVVDVLVGADDKECPLEYLSNKIQFREYIQKCLEERKIDTGSSSSNVTDFPTGIVLSKGMAQANLAIYKKVEGQFVKEEFVTSEVGSLICHLREEMNVSRFINVGASSLMIDSTMTEVADFDVQVEDSISVDPMLTWYWPSLSKVFKMTAN